MVDYGQKMKEALEHANTIIQHSSQALLLGQGDVADSLHFSLVGSYWKKGAQSECVLSGGESEQP